MSSTEDRLKQLADVHLDLGASPDLDAHLGEAPAVSSVFTLKHVVLNLQPLQPSSRTLGILTFGTRRRG